MSKFGAYREGMAPFVFGDDVWELIGQAVPLAAREGWLPELRVGEMVEPDGEFVHDMMLGEWGEVIPLVYDECVKTKDLLVSACDLMRAEYRKFQPDAAVILPEPCRDALVDACSCVESELPSRLSKWASKHIHLSPAYCDGRYPLPVQRVDGRWAYPRNRAHDLVDAEIEFEIGSEGPVWFCAGTRVQKPSLSVAMQAVDVHLMEAL